HLPESEQRDMLALVAQSAPTALEEGRTQLLAWRAGDVSALEAQMDTGLLADPELREALLDGRNRDWAEKVDRLLRGGGRIFVAAGAAHMAGDTGLPALLAVKGFTVRRVQ